ncbi:glucose-6-phosphate dehydrogenase assembly protein OpcA [Svornostia abyssi]|uniref:Glucose-6-phosphate dehydrogenase assembly protein OpcA n=1 Tax=Svornostia abyssi TaxID=2898438 RepID=A0ABY5PN56_9ACTN|nr:glucose-6-phosphate dehydrogenase assembly protein OpcA [Parviterribacteraceae bacterium J379]
MPAVSDSVWREQDTTPGAIEAALRQLLADRHKESDSYVPARALNLVCVVDKDWSGEIANRLRKVGRYHASRTIVCSVEFGRTTIDATATIASDTEPKPGEFALLRETVILAVGEQHLPMLNQIVDPLVVTDLATVVWSPHGHAEAVDALTTAPPGGAPLAQVVLLDSVDEPDADEALSRVVALCDRSAIVDLAWLRSTPWRERIAAVFDPPARRRELRLLNEVAIGARPGSETAALLLLGWLCAQLGWTPSRLSRHGQELAGKVRAHRGDVTLRVVPAEHMTVPGLDGITLTTEDGSVTSLTRGTGGLTERRTEPDGRTHEWTVLGASRGEAGILGEGIRQALLRDPTYAPAVRAARALL